jgi:hypothetical protein
LPTNLDEYPASSIPGLIDTPIVNFPGALAKKAIDVPGLAELPLAKMPKFNIPAGYQLAKFDVIRTKEVADRKVISGSKEEPNAPCTDATKCNHIEVQGLMGGAINGAQIVDGDTQRVRGGYGLLGNISGGQEAPGFYPYGDRIKEVYYNFQAQDGTIDRGWYFDFCHSSWFVDFGCTPHFIGPIPTGSLHEGSQVPLLLGNISIPVDAREVVAAASSAASDSSPTEARSVTSLSPTTEAKPVASRSATSAPPVSTVEPQVSGIYPQKLAQAITGVIPDASQEDIDRLLTDTAKEIDTNTNQKYHSAALLDRVVTKYIAGNNTDIDLDAQSLSLGMSISEIIDRVNQLYVQK